MLGYMWPQSSCQAASQVSRLTGEGSERRSPEAHASREAAGWRDRVPLKAKWAGPLISTRLQRILIPEVSTPCKGLREPAGVSGGGQAVPGSAGGGSAVVQRWPPPQLEELGLSSSSLHNLGLSRVCVL